MHHSAQDLAEGVYFTECIPDDLASPSKKAKKKSTKIITREQVCLSVCLSRFVFLSVCNGVCR